MRALAAELLLATDLERGLDCLNSAQGGQLELAVQALLRPVSVCGPPSCQIPFLATLPLAVQANLALLLKAAPHRFPAGQRAALLAGLAQGTGTTADGAEAAGHGSLLQLLAAEVGGSIALGASAPAVPACPDLLYTAQPCFPWAPVLTDAAAAAALQKQQAAEAAAAARQQARQAAAAAAGKRPAEGERGAGEEGSTAKRQRQAVAQDSQHPPAARHLPTGSTPNAELDTAVSTVKAALKHIGDGAADAAAAVLTPQLRAALDLLLAHAAAGGPAGTAALTAAGLDSLEDDSLLLLLLTEAVSASSSFARCSTAATGLLLPRVRALAGPAPRALSAAAEHVATCNPQAYISAFLQPLLSGPGLNKHQAELLGGTLKAALPAQLLPAVLAAACATAPAVGAASSAPAAAAAVAAGGGSGWNEHTVGVLQAVLNAKPQLTASGVAQLAAAFAAATSAPAASVGAELAASPKYAKLVLSVVKQYPEQAAAAKQLLQAAAQALKSFMAKSVLAAVAKL